MIQYIKLFFRHFFKHKLYSLFLLLGLIIALTTFLIISIYADHEYSYDRFHKNHKQIYRVLMKDSVTGTKYAKICYPITEVIQSFPEVLASVKIKETELLIENKNNYIREENVYYVESSFFEIFDFSLVSGYRKKLNNPGNVFISEKFAKKLFSKIDVIGQEINIKNIAGEEISLIIQGVFKNFPSNSHFQAEILLPFIHIEKYYQQNTEFEWTNNNIYYYVQTLSPKIAENKINNNLKRSGYQFVFNLQSLDKIHLFSNDIDLNIEKQSVFKQLIISIGVAFLIIFIAVANYLIYILVVANSRIKEYIIRRIVGASKARLFFQIFSEILIQISIAIPFVLLLSFSIIPYIENYFHISTDITRIKMLLVYFIVGIVIIVLFSSLLLSSYLVFPRLSALINLLVNFRSGRFGIVKYISIIQLSLFIALIISFLSVNKQLNFATDNDTIGFNYENQVSIKINDRNIIKQWNAIKNEMLRIPGIINVAACMSDQPSFSTQMAGFKWNYDKRGKKYGYMKMGFLNEEDKAKFQDVFEVNNITSGYFDALGINEFEGDDFSGSKADAQNIIVNKSFIDKYEISDPINRTIDFLDSKYTIIGVVNNFRTKSIFKEKGPIVFWYTNRFLRQIIIRYDGISQSELINKIENIWKDFLPNSPMEYQITEMVINKYYHKEKQLLTFIKFFSILGMSMVFVNLLGFSKLYFTSRKKEIGIRKILGARLYDLTKNLLRPYILYVLVSSMVGYIIANSFLRFWFNQFNEVIKLSITEYLLSILSIILFCVIVVFVNIISVSRICPVEVIKYE